MVPRKVSVCVSSTLSVARIGRAVAAADGGEPLVERERGATGGIRQHDLAASVRQVVGGGAAHIVDYRGEGEEVVGDDVTALGDVDPAEVQRADGELDRVAGREDAIAVGIVDQRNGLGGKDFRQRDRHHAGIDRLALGRRLAGVLAVRDGNVDGIAGGIGRVEQRTGHVDIGRVG
ncbi:MAG: hypothetical protein AcusKO_24160 [Acuticoccus sp.]